MNALLVSATFWTVGLLFPTAPATPTPTLAQQARIEVGAESEAKFEFEWDGLHADGTPNAAANKVRFRFVPIDVPNVAQPVVILVAQLVVTGKNQVAVKSVLPGMVSGDYDATVEVISPNGNPSGFSTPPVALTVFGKKPSVPTDFGLSGSTP